MTDLFLAWQDPGTRRLFPVGMLARKAGVYRFAYTRGALEAKEQSNFQPLVSFPELELVYESADLFPLFANRVLSRSRPDYDSFVDCLNLVEDRDDPIMLLARSGGRRRTDNFEVFSRPERDADGSFRLHFFAHGLTHLPASSVERVRSLVPGERLLLMQDFQNPMDSNCLVLRTAGIASPDDIHIVGYCPRYLAEALLDLTLRHKGEVRVTVERINQSPAPMQLRLLCALTARWPEGFGPFAQDGYLPLRSASSGDPDATGRAPSRRADRFG